ncbi:hypothetical protein IGI04_034376 [Brassica rapa subsp. trilocularis]|uniref:Phosphatidate cytidylyltransferase n=1 Tax=Brassica rapa subsp. trilocularis TaxID=1813537 RepID=A0ABQ7L8J7_BRACM|nr:hypothetical protein IGI04_034376 [Brassica rapa subsp. trilocularis]
MEEESSNVTSSSPSTPVQRLRHRKRSSTEVLDGDKVNASPLLVNDRNKYKSFMIRTYSTLWMIAGFVMVVYMGHLYITAMVLVIQIFMAKELFNLLRKAPEDKCLPGIKQLNWHFFFTAMLFVYGRILSQRLANTVTADQFLYRLVTGLIKYHMAICYFLFHVVHSDIKEEDVQVPVWPICMDPHDFDCRLYSVLLHCRQHIRRNLLFLLLNYRFLLPASLIIINDIFAYIFGFFFGRTPLIKLSPKKTWEGFIGASVTTIISAFVLANVLGRFPWLTCPRQDLSTGWLQCDADPLFKPEPFTLPAWIPGWFPWKEIEVLPVQWHALCLGLFASIIAPFGGFFASGFKRAFKIKDFGDSIPGHGGITDRMDCQMVMAVFAYIYLQSFIVSQSVSVDKILDQILTNLSFEEQQALFSRLGQMIGNS